MSGKDRRSGSPRTVQMGQGGALNEGQGGGAGGGRGAKEQRRPSSLRDPVSLRDAAGSCVLLKKEKWSLKGVSSPQS